MAKQNEKIAELTYLFRIMQLIHEVDSIDKIHRMLISFCTCGRVIGCRRAVLFTVDQNRQLLRGAIGLERPGSAGSSKGGGLSFEEMAREVFDGFERIESTDLTLHAKTFNVPLDWHRSALVKAVRTSYPVFAEGRLSEFATDPFFSFFDTEQYVAIPLRSAEIGGSGRSGENREAVTAVLAADGSKEGKQIGVERISMLYSLVQQASLAVYNLREFAECDRRFRVLSKLNETVKQATSIGQLDEAVKQGMTMMCRAMRGSGAILKDYGRGKTLFVKTEHSYTLDSDENDDAVADSFDSVLERAAGLMQPVQGDSSYPLLKDAGRIARFAACPLIVHKDVVGALALYSRANPAAPAAEEFTSKDLSFLEVGSGLLASALSTRNIEDRLRRSEEFLEELRTNLSRERDRSRLGDHGIAYSERIRDELGRMRKILSEKDGEATVVPALRSIVDSVTAQTDQYLQEAASARSKLRHIHLFKLVSRIATAWSKEIENRGVEVELKIPVLGPHLLMDKQKVSQALNGIFSSISSVLTKDDRVLVECSTENDLCRIVIADTGIGLPGEVLSRLFMPFRDVQFEDERKNALSLAGEIVNQHGGEIVMKTSLSWKTILILSFPGASNRDRRKSSKDRRSSARDRRTPVKKP